MAGLASYELWRCGGILIIVLAVMFFAVRMLFFIIKKKSIGRRMDEEYGQPQKYNIKRKGNWK